MPALRAIRTLNAVEAGTLDASALETVLAGDAGRRAEMTGLLGVRGYSRRICDASLTATAFVNSPSAVGLVMGNSVAATEFSNNSVSMSLTRASTAAMRAATASVPGMRNWTDKFPLSTRASGAGAQALNAVAYGNNLYVAVGTNGVVSISSDRVTWTLQSANGVLGASPIMGIVFGLGVFAVVQANGQICTSTDGVVWTLRYTITSCQGAYKMVFADGKFLALGLNGSNYPVVVYSTAPASSSWTLQIIASAAVAQYDIVFADGVWFSVGKDAASSASCFRSTDLITWTQVTAPWGSNVIAVSVLWSNKTMFAFGASSGILCRSANFGTSWNQLAYPANHTAIAGQSLGVAHNGVLFMTTTSANGNPGVQYSVDNAATWQQFSFTTEPATRVCVANNVIFLLGGNGLLRTNY